jgi:hypothetical protein
MAQSFRRGDCALTPENPSHSYDFLPKRQRDLMGHCPNDALRVDFDRQIKLEFHGSTVNSNAGLLAYRDVDDAERLCLAPALRTVVGGRAKDQTAASTSEMARFEIEMLSTKENLKHVIDLSGQWIDQAHRPRKLTKLILDMDSSVSET